MGRIGRVDRVQRHLGEGHLGIFRVLVKRGARARRNVGPAFLGSDQRKVFLGGCPFHEGLGSFHLLRASGNAEVPGPQPVAALAKALVRGEREAHLVGHLGILRVGHEGCRHRGVDPHAALAGLEEGEVFVEAIGRCTGRAVLVHQVEVIRQRLLPGCAIELRLPLFIEPAGAVGIGHGGQEGHVLAPAGLAAQADAVLFLALVRHLLGGLLDEVPGGRSRHIETGGLHQIGAIHHHGGLAVERRGVKLAFGRQAVADGGQNVVGVIACRQVVEVGQPTTLGPDRNFIGSDRHDVELAALGGDVLRHALSQHVFLKRHPLHLDVRMLLIEVRHQALHADHVAVVDGRDGDRGFGEGSGGKRRQGARAQEGTVKGFHCFSSQRREHLLTVRIIIHIRARELSSTLFTLSCELWLKALWSRLQEGFRRCFVGNQPRHQFSGQRRAQRHHLRGTGGDA